jgi:ATP-dependent DNA ligase
MADRRLQEPSDWRPQAFGRRSFRQVRDPVIEPLWRGIRVLAHVTSGEVALLDASGERRAYPLIEEHLAGAVLAESAILDGYLTDEAAGTSLGLTPTSGVEAPTAGEMARQMIAGGGRNHRRDDLAAMIEETTEYLPDDDEAVVFVAVDLVWLDGDPLLEVPLLERKRLLDSVLQEDGLIRLSVHVRPPIDPWIPTWRSIGFRGLAYKDVNSRYRPGENNDGWATAPIPRN